VSAAPHEPESADQCRHRLVKSYEYLHPLIPEEVLEFGKILDSFSNKPSVIFQKDFFYTGDNADLFHERTEKVPYPESCRELPEYQQKIEANFPCAGPFTENEWIPELGELLDDNQKAADVFKSFITCVSDERFFFS